MINKGMVIGVSFITFALICGVVSLDYARGRVPETSSALILDVLSEGVAKQCRRDISATAQKHIMPGMERAEALKVISDAAITLPKPWFWKAGRTQSLMDEPDRIRATRTLRATAFGNELMLLDMKIKDGKVEAVTARVECAFS